jgi:3D (Asp-Asp-Asp) domain-containing protein
MNLMLSKISVIAFCAALPLLAVKQRVELVTTDHADFAAGGLIQIEGSTGELNIAGWDQPSVEVIASRYTFEEERKAKGTAKGKKVDVVKMVAANGELTIATSGHERGIHVDYQIMVPRGSRLMIHHHIGTVVVTDVGGDIDATNGAGDIVVQLREPEHYTIDAKVKFGTVYSDFNQARHHDVIGEKLMDDVPAGDARAPSHHINLRVGAGGISVQKMEGPAPEAKATAGL